VSAQDTPEQVTGTGPAAETPEAEAPTAAQAPAANVWAAPGTATAAPDAAATAAAPAAPLTAWPIPVSEETAAAARRRRLGLIASGAGLALVAVLTGVGFAVNHYLEGYNAYRYAAPQQFKGLPQTTVSTPYPHDYLSGYGTPGDGMVSTLAAVKPMVNPSTAVDEFVKRDSATDPLLRNAHSVDAGPHGGRMVCAAGSVSGSPALPGLPGGVCVWADHSMLGFFKEISSGPESPINLDQVTADARAFRLLCEQPA
jgi:hypothetical protein